MCVRVCVCVCVCVLEILGYYSTSLVCVQLFFSLILLSTEVIDLAEPRAADCYHTIVVDCAPIVFVDSMGTATIEKVCTQPTASPTCTWWRLCVQFGSLLLLLNVHSLLLNLRNSIFKCCWQHLTLLFVTPCTVMDSLRGIRRRDCSQLFLQL